MKHMALAMFIASSPAWGELRPPPTPERNAGYRSAFADYRPLRDEAIGDWPRANDEVGRRQGHMGHRDAENAAAPGTPAEETVSNGTGVPAPVRR